MPMIQNSTCIGVIQRRATILGMLFAILSDGMQESKALELPLEAPFTRITNSVTYSEAANSVSAAWGDYDNDGWLDLFVGRFQVRNVLFRNNRDGTFARVFTNSIATEVPAHANGAAWVDYDNDGRLDLAVANVIDSVPSLFVYRGNTNGSHSRMNGVGLGPPATDTGRALAAAWADYDQDGYLDLFLAKGGLGRDLPDALYRNERNGRFSADTDPIIVPALRSCQGSWAVFDNDGDPDLFITHAANQGNLLYRNDRNGQFVDVTRQGGLTNQKDSVGAAWGDFDNDGDLDLFVTNLSLELLGGTDTSNLLYQNNGDGTFTQITSGEIATDLGHFLSCAWIDYDNDGWLDLFVTFDPPRTLPSTAVKNRLYRNLGDGTFAKVTIGRLVTDYANAGGAAWGDYDNDGFLDVFIANGTINSAQRNGFYRNNGNSNGWIKLRCIGTLSNRSAVGTKIRVKATIGGKEVWQMRQVSGGEGWLAFNSLDVIFGLGDATVIDLLRLEWPSGTVQELRNIPTKEMLEIYEPIQLTKIRVPQAQEGVVHLRIAGETSRPLRINASSDLIQWSQLELKRQESSLLEFADPEFGVSTHRFYRVVADTHK